MTDEQNIARREADLEYTVERYRSALDVGDEQGVAQVLQEAIEAPALDRRISEINLEAEKEMYEDFCDESKPRLYDKVEFSEEPPLYDPEELVW